MTGELQETFVVPASAGNYAPEVLYLTGDGSVTGLGRDARVNEMTVVLQNLIASAVVEVDLLQPGGDPDTDADWWTAMKTFNTAGLQTLLQFAGWMGVRVRVKSGGTGGNQVVGVSWR